MTLYLVKHGETDYRLHDETGDKMDHWDNRPDASILRSELADKVVFRNVWVHGESEVPFELS